MAIFRYLVVFIASAGAILGSPAKKAPLWTEYEADFQVQDGAQPLVILRWWSMETKGSCHEYPEIWRKGLKFGLGNRFRVTSLTGVDHDGMKKEGAVVIAVIEDTIAKKTITFQSDGKRHYRSFSDEWMRTRTEKFPPGEPKQGTDK